MSNIEPEVKAFFKTIVSSVFLGLFWLMLNLTLGIYFGLLFIKGNISVGNIVYYLFALSSFVFLIRYYIKVWKKKFPHG